MMQYQQEAATESAAYIKLLQAVSIAGFVLLAISTSLKFVPIAEQAWRDTSLGFTVMLFAVLGCVAVERKNFFTAFFIAVFAAFFLIHDVIILYDGKAVEMGREIGPEGWLRPMVLIFEDAFHLFNGVSTGLIGVLTALTGVCIAWVVTVVKDNQDAAMAAIALTEKKNGNGRTAREFTAEEMKDWVEPQDFSDEESEKDLDEEYDEELDEDTDEDTDEELV